MRRAATALLFSLSFLGLVEASALASLEEKFQGPLDDGRWEVVRVFDTRSDRVEAGEGRLEISLDTLGTDDATVKVRGIRSRDAFEFGKRPLRVETTIDWNAQANGCYLSAGLALVPETYALDKDPREAPEGLSFEWIGVPPGKNVRPYLARRHANALIELYTEGWPQARREDRVGRASTKSKVTLEVSNDSVRLLEGEKELFRGKEGLSGKFKLELFVTGHSNYPNRTVYFQSCEVAEVRSGA